MAFVCRIGTMRSHSQALTIKLKKDIPIDELNDIISKGNQWVKFVPNEKDASINLFKPIRSFM